MSTKFKPIDLSAVKTYRLADRPSMVSTEDFARPWQSGSSYADFLSSLPDILAGSELKRIVAAIADA